MLTLNGVGFSYKKKEVLKSIDLKLEPGYIYGLLGGNGEGKSTLFRLFCGLLFPKSGSIELNGLAPRKRSPQFLEKIMLLPEDIEVPALTPMKYANHFGGFYPKFDLEQYKALLLEFDVPLEQNMNQMSLGQGKKSLIAFSIACNTDFLLLDEPTNGLDIVSKSKFRKIIASHMTDERTIVISTHQVKDLEQLIDRILVLNNQKIIFNEKVSTIGEKLNFTYLNNTTEKSEVIYEEPSLRGNLVVMKNLSNQDSNVDLELLFKAIQLQPQQINQIFQPSYILQ